MKRPGNKERPFPAKGVLQRRKDENRVCGSVRLAMPRLWRLCEDCRKVVSRRMLIVDNCRLLQANAGSETAVS